MLAVVVFEILFSMDQLRRADCYYGGENWKWKWLKVMLMLMVEQEWKLEYHDDVDMQDVYFFVQLQNELLAKFWKSTEPRRL